MDNVRNQPAEQFRKQPSPRPIKLVKGHAEEDWVKKLRELATTGEPLWQGLLAGHERVEAMLRGERPVSYDHTYVISTQMLRMMGDDLPLSVRLALEENPRLPTEDEQRLMQSGQQILNRIYERRRG